MRAITDKLPYTEDERKQVEAMVREQCTFYTKFCNTLGVWNTHQFFFDNMRVYRGVRPTERRMTMKECYSNAAIQSGANGYQFVDGFVTVAGFPIRHAWNLDHEGNPVDFTLDPTDAHGERIYMGVPFPGDVAWEVARSRVWPYSEGLVGALQRMPDKRRNKLLKKSGYPPKEKS